MRNTPILCACILAVSTALAHAGPPVPPSEKPVLKPAQKQAMQQQGVARTDRLNADTLGLIARGMPGGDKAVETKDSVALRLQITQIREDLNLYQQLYDAPAKAGQDQKGTEAKLKRLERFVDKAAIDELRARIKNPPDSAKQAAKEKEDKAKQAEEIAKTENAAAPKAGLKTAAPPLSLKKEAAAAPPAKEPMPLWQCYYYKFVLLMPISCD